MATVFDSEKYTHPADRAALKALKAIPGFSALLKAFMSVWNERQQKILNMSSRIRIGENQMRKYYDYLPPICEKLGIAVPELYLEMNVVPNAYTSGDTNPFIVMTSGLLKTIPEELIPTILAHECGHIACRHVLYLTMGRMVLQGAGSVLSSILPLGSLLTVPLQIAFYYWMRCSEFSADRAAVLCDGTDRRMQEVCMRMAGWDKAIDAEVSMEAFLEQASGYRDMINESKWNKALEFMILSQSSHPLMAVRATECHQWYQSEDYRDAGVDRPAPQARLSTQPLKIGESREIKPSGSACSVALPAEYQPLPSKPGDPPGSAAFGHVSTQSDSFVQVCSVEREQAICFDTPEELVRRIHRDLSEDEGLIKVECGISAGGRQYAYSIIKARRTARSTEYTATVHLDDRDSVIAVQAFFMETGSPGFREAAIRGQAGRGLQAGPAAGASMPWSMDPYDPLYTKGQLMNESEKEKYDARFPLHPLSEARRFVNAVISMN